MDNCPAKNLYNRSKSSLFCFNNGKPIFHIHFNCSLIPIRNMQNNWRNVVTLHIRNSKLQ